MSSIDDRIVRLEVQDSEFSKRLEQDEKALKKFDDAISNVGNSGLANNIDKIASKFSNLGIAGVRAIENITDRAISAGTTLVKSLSVDNIASGWDKLVKQTQAVGTLSIQGYDQKEVDDVIKRLMWYSDETSYNFSDMLTSMTKFTAQGYKLKDALTTLEGIANWSAVAGQNAAAGSSAMTALSKAIGRGYIQQADWGSLQTLMMDNKQVRQMILDTAVDMGTLKKLGDDLYQSTSDAVLSNLGYTKFGIDQFAAYLTTGKWLTSDVLVATMQKYAEAVEPVYQYVEKYNVSTADAIKALSGQLSDQALSFFSAAQEARSLKDALESIQVGSASTWQKTFNIIFGDYERQKEIWTDLSGYLYDLFVESGNARNALLEEWSAGGGADALIQGFYNIMDAVIKLRNVIKTAFQSVFPPKTAQDLLNITEKFKSFTEGLLQNDRTVLKIGKTFQGFFTIFRGAKDILQAVLQPIANIFGPSSGLLDSILTITSAVGNLITNFVLWMETSGILAKISSVVSTVLKVMGTVFKYVGLTALVGITYIIKGISWLTQNASTIGDTLLGIIDKIKSAFKAFASLFTRQKKANELTVEVDRPTAQTYNATDYYGGSDVNDDSIGLFDRIGDAFKSMGNTIKTTWTNKIAPAFSKFGEAFKEGGVINNAVKFIISAATKILGIIVVFRVLWSVVDLITGIISGLGGLFRMLGIIPNAITAFIQSFRANAILKFSIAAGILTASLYALQNLGWDKLTDSLKMVDKLFDSITTGINKLSFSAAAGLALLAQVNLWPFIGTVVALAAGAFALGLAAQNFESFGAAIKSVFSQENADLIAGFLYTLAGVFTVVSWGMLPLIIGKLLKAFTKLAKNIESVFGNLVSVTLVKKDKDTSFSAQILKIATAVMIAVGAIYMITNVIDLNEINEALGIIGGIATVLFTMATMLMVLTKVTGGFDASGILKMTIGVAVIVGTIMALSAFGQSDYAKKLVEAGIAVTAVLTLLAGTLYFISSMPITEFHGKTIKALAASFISLAISGLILSASIMLLKSLEWEELAVGLVGVAGGIIAMGIALRLALSAITYTKGSAGAVFGVAAAFLLIGVATNLLATAITSLSSLDMVSVATSTAALAVGIIAMGGALQLLGSCADTFLREVGHVAVLAGVIGVLYLLYKLIETYSNLNMTGVDNITVAAVGLVGAVAALGVISNALFSTAASIKSMLIMFASIAGIIIVLNLLVDILKKFEDVSVGSMVKLAAMVVIIELAAAGLIGLGTALGALFSMLTPILPYIIGAFVAIGAAILIISSAITKTAPALGQLAESIANAFNTIVTAIGNFNISIATAFQIVTESMNNMTHEFAVDGPIIASNIDSIGISVSNAIRNITSSVAYGIAVIAAWPLKLLDLLKEAFGTSSQAVGEGLVGGVATGMNDQKSSSWLSQAVGNVLTFLFNAFDVHSPSSLTVPLGEGLIMGAAKGMVSSNSQSRMKAAANGALIVTVETLTSDTAQETMTDAGEQLGEAAAGGFWSKFKNAFAVVSSSVFGGRKIGEKVADILTLPSLEDLEEQFKENAGDLNIDEWLEKLKSSFKDNNLNYGSFFGSYMSGGLKEDFEDWIKTMNQMPDFKKGTSGFVDLEKAQKLADKIANVSGDKTLGANFLRFAQAYEKAFNAKDTISMTRYMSRLESIIDKVYESESNMTSVMTDFNVDDMFDADSFADKFKTSMDVEGLGEEFGLSAKNVLKEEEASMNEWIRQNSELSTVWYDGVPHQTWTYTGPMEGQIDEWADWVYEGPTAGEYDKYHDEYLAMVDGRWVSVDEWMSTQSQYLQSLQEQSLATGQNVDVISQNTDSIKALSSEQFDMDKLFNSNMEDYMSQISSQLTGLDSSIGSLGSSFSGMGVYLDGDTMVGELSDKFNSQYNFNQSLTSMGVIR